MAIFDPTTLVGVHALLSVVALLAGVVVVAGLISADAAPRGSRLFLVTAIATSASGFILPAKGLMPSHIVGIVALIVLAIVILASAVFQRAGIWRRIHAAGMVASLWFLVFVAIAQAFAKVPALHAAAPTQSEPPFAVTQLVVLALFFGLGWATMRTRAPRMLAARP